MPRLPQKLLAPPVLLGTWLLASALAAFLPKFYVAHHANWSFLLWQDQAHDVGRAIVKDWVLARPVPGFRTGDEPWVRDRLDADPMLWALVDPRSGQVWVREGDRLRRPRSGGSDESTRLVAWARAAEASGRNPWLPPVEDHPKALQESVLALATGSWWEFKRWVPSGTENPDRMLGRFMARYLGPEAPYRFSITRYGRDPQTTGLDGQAIHRRAKVFSAAEIRPTYVVIFQDLSQPFTEPWVVGMWATPAQEARVQHDLRVWTREAWGAYALFVVTLGGACLIQHSVSRRDRLRADQLAFLAHSLKTPLTILKLRCDTIRNASLPREVQDSQVARVGDEVDRLVRLIEAGLDGARPRGDAPRPDWIDADFFRRLHEQMEPIFEAEGRTLALDLEDTGFRAPLRALNPALNTLLENALVHGEGAVTLRVARRGRRVELQVVDEGQGIPMERISGLVAVGAAPEGRGHTLVPGHGMGLFLLARTALHEGWGLRFDSVEGTGFRVVLELPA